MRLFYHKALPTCAMALLISVVSFGLMGCEQNAHLEPVSAVDAMQGGDASDVSDAIKPSNQAVEPLSCHNESIVNAYQNKWSNRQVKGCGDVVAILPDDTKGSHHQRMIVRLSDVIPGQTILIAHNIDLAPKVVPLTVGQTVMFYGEYEYNEQGGVVHWTHHDPAARHQDGWILSNDTFFD